MLQLLLLELVQILQFLGGALVFPLEIQQLQLLVHKSRQLGG